jgi:capsule polysaccharide modification protein KpsS
MHPQSEKWIWTRIGCSLFKVHLLWQGWQALLCKMHSDFEAYFEVKKRVLYTGKYGT